MSSQPATHDDVDAQPADSPDESTDEESPPDSGETVTHTSQPTLKPALLALSVVAGVWFAVVGLLLSNPAMILTAELTAVVEIVVHLVFVFIALRLFVRLYILSRMSYTVRDGRIIREYALLYRYRRREIPIQHVRGVEVSRDPVESLLGYGTVSVLSGGVDQGLGFLEFENVPHPDAVAKAIDNTLEK
ncbi:PH domain-containing protein [Halorubrum sp. N11]|uniref:PH domain-containing protein n=1 Tax=Halorubrum sp. N11 TaxID=3402276 RepID=UPI003EB75E0C